MPTRAGYADLFRFRQAAHGLTAPLESPLAVAERLLAIQAQDFAAACWALGVRAAGATQTDVISALERGEIVRSWPMRGTLHFVPARELGWMLQLTAPRMIAGLVRRHRQLELDDDEALAEFLLRYLAGHGPATLKDYVWWTKGTMAGAKTGLAIIRDRLTSFELGGATYWMTAERADSAPAASSRSRSLHVLPGFDEYLLGYQDRAPVLAPEFADRVVPGANGIFKPLIVSKGRIAGTWRRTANGTRVAIEAQPFQPLSQTEHAGFAAGARAYGRFLGLRGEVA